jgi:Homeodomain-like domain
MNKPNKFIKTLSETDYNQLLENYQTGNNFRPRNRSHAILLFFQKYSIDETAEICRVHRTTVGIWIGNWNEFEKTGLEDGERNSLIFNVIFRGCVFCFGIKKHSLL